MAINERTIQASVEWDEQVAIEMCRRSVASDWRAPACGRRRHAADRRREACRAPSCV